jgi:hypothetical protein
MGGQMVQLSPGNDRSRENAAHSRFRVFRQPVRIAHQASQRIRHNRTGSDPSTAANSRNYKKPSSEGLF